MKKLFILLAGVALLAACEKEPNVAPKVEDEAKQMTALDRYLQRVAEEGIAMLGDTPTRAGARRVIDPSRTHAFVKATTRSEEDTLFYVVNFADSTGFALVDADTTSRTPLIAVTEQGNFTPGEVTNTGFDDYMELMLQRKSEISVLGSGVIPHPIVGDSTAVMHQFSKVIKGPEIIVGPLLEVEWGQDAPYNTYCEYSIGNGVTAPTGCVPTAIAQIMSYYEYPDTLMLTHPYRGNRTFVVLDWNKMKQHNQVGATDDCLCMNHIELEHLLREIGARCFAWYHFSTTVSLQDALDGIESLGYTFSNGYYTYNRENVGIELDEGRPVYCSGLPATGNGHTWVIDGYLHQSILWQTYEEIPGIMLPRLIKEEDCSRDMLHINWGWDGDCNGYFQPGYFTCTTQDGQLHDYQRVIYILTNLKPLEL